MGFGPALEVLRGWAIDKVLTHKFTTASSLSTYLETTPDNPTFLGILKKSFNAAVNPDGTLSSAVMVKDWHNIWLCFAVYALILAILFAFLFKHKHNPAEISEIKH